MFQHFDEGRKMFKVNGDRVIGTLGVRIVAGLSVVKGKINVSLSFKTISERER